MDYLLITDNIITNIIVCADDATAASFGAVPSYDGARIGDTYNPPPAPEPEPTEVEQLRARTAQLARDIHPDLSIHDFRMTMGPMYTNLIFDLVVPYSVTMPPAQVKDALVQALQAENPNYHAVIHIDRSYVV